MLQTGLARWLLASALLGLIILTGCGGAGKPVTVQGKVVFPSNVKLAPNDSIELRFVGQGEGNKASAATNVTPADQSFTAKDVLPGNYKLVLKVSPYSGMPDAQKRAQALETFNRGIDDQASKLTYEVTKDPNQTITIDLTKNTVTKN